ncbi:MAG: hypothetical protein ACYTFA_13570 [Planctomycetota bacterium]|jgi:uncharacterized membrane protein YozB (DUF420 family)
MLSTVELISCGIFVVLVIGVLNRGRKRVHIPLMVIAFVADMAMVLYIELTRQAIETAATQMTPLMGVHVLLSVIVIGLYVGQIVTGVKKARGRPHAWHGKAGIGFLLCRFGNLITSLMVTHVVQSGA